MIGSNMSGFGLMDFEIERSLDLGKAKQQTPEHRFLPVPLEIGEFARHFLILMGGQGFIGEGEQAAIFAFDVGAKDLREASGVIHKVAVSIGPEGFFEPNHQRSFLVVGED